MSHTQVLRDGSTSNHSQSKIRWRLYPGRLICFLTFIIGSCLLPAALPCSACLHWETQGLHLQYTSWKGTITAKKENHICLCSIMYWALDQDRRDDGKERRETCNIGINVHVCMYGGGGGGFSATWWAYPEDLFCFTRRRERSDRNRVCHTLAPRHTHTSQDFVSLTYRWVYEHPRSKIRAPITNWNSSSDWSWQMLSLDPGNVSHKGFDGLSPLFHASVWLCVIMCVH